MRERDQLARRHERLTAEREPIETKPTALADRPRVIDQLTPATGEATDKATTTSVGASADARVLRSAAGRQTTVGVLRDSDKAGAIHYREWHALLEQDTASRDPVGQLLVDANG